MFRNASPLNDLPMPLPLSTTRRRVSPRTRASIRRASQQAGLAVCLFFPIVGCTSRGQPRQADPKADPASTDWTALSEDLAGFPAVIADPDGDATAPGRESAVPDAAGRPSGEPGSASSASGGTPPDPSDGDADPASGVRLAPEMRLASSAADTDPQTNPDRTSAGFLSASWQAPRTGPVSDEPLGGGDEARTADASAPAESDSDDENPAEQLPTGPATMELAPAGEIIAESPEGVLLRSVVESVHANFPLVEAVYLERDRTAGEQTAAWGAFDTRTMIESRNQPLGFYETYRQNGVVAQPLYGGGEVFGGYRIGRGQFEPWYLERQTNRGGEFRAGFMLPLARNRDIDARRAELWRATYDRQIAEPEIRRELIRFVLDASVLYWEWVAAGRQYRIGATALRLAEERNERLRDQVAVGEVDPPVLKDNERAIAEREAALFDRRRRFEQAAVKLSLFLRDEQTDPVIPTPDALPAFPAITPFDRSEFESFVETALSRRPELEAFTLKERQLRVDLAEAANDLLPNVDAGVVGSQDMGQPTSPKRDKSQFELEVGMFFELPVQRRKGFGKLRATRAKLAQLEANRRFTVNKIAAEVQAAVAAVDAAAQQYRQSEEAVALADELAEIERFNFSVGETDLLSVFLREQFAIEAADQLVVALFRYYVARAELMAAAGYLWPDEVEWRPLAENVPAPQPEEFMPPPEDGPPQPEEP